jgi:hypothetical protein
MCEDSIVPSWSRLSPSESILSIPFPPAVPSAPFFPQHISLLTYQTLASLSNTGNDPENISLPLMCRMDPCKQLILALAGASPVGLAELKCVLGSSPFLRLLLSNTRWSLTKRQLFLIPKLRKGTYRIPVFPVQNRFSGEISRPATSP